VKAIGANEFGGPETLQLLDLAEPRPGPGEVLVKVD
jgi:NADPH:quinone reductase-like Zn-dependent oxidoreductase